MADAEFDDLFGASSDEEEVVAPKKLTKKKQPKSTGMAALLENDSGDDSDDSAFDGAAGDDGSSDEGAPRKLSRKRARPAAKRPKRKPRAAAAAASSGIDAAAAAAAKKKKKKNDGSAYGVEEDDVRTKDDEAFIASDDDDTGMMEEYNKQQLNFVDAPDAEFDRPDREEDSERGGYRERTVVDLARDSIRARKGVKKKKVDERRQKEDDAQKAGALLRKMLVAASDDRNSFKAKRPGLEKAKLVRAVTSMLKDPNLAAPLLDQNVLGVLAGAVDQAGWLDVMPNGKLPALSLRSQLLAELVKLPITQKHMNECRFGEVRATLVLPRLFARHDRHACSRAAPPSLPFLPIAPTAARRCSSS